MTNNSRKRKSKDVGTDSLLQLKPLQGHQIEAVTKTYNDLRAAGVDSVIELPCTVVAGDTSSGKSSVMCRLTGLPFPRGEGVVTKFATEVDMMPADTEEIRVSIRPDEGRSDEQKHTLQRFKPDMGVDGFEATFARACNLMEDLGGNTLFADVLHIYLKGPDLRTLTVIDLPGLIHATTATVSEADRELSEKIAKHYVSKPKTIVLAVITASNDVVNQGVTSLSRNHDKAGERTMGIVTKIDTVCGKAKDRKLLSILSNEEIPLQLGWHALMNTIEDNEDASDQQITQAEQEFFKTERFRSLDQSATGIDNLRARVVRVVGQKLVHTLPALRLDVARKLEELKVMQRKMGEPAKDFASQQKLMTRICGRFQDIAQAEVDGVYSTKLLKHKNGTTSATHKDTLRSEIEGLHRDFASAMRAYGGTKKFHDLGESSDHTTEPGFQSEYEIWEEDTVETNRAQAINWVLEIQRAASRSGVSSSTNDQIVTTLFRELSKRWAKLAHEHIDAIYGRCKAIISEAMLNRDTDYDDSVADHIAATWIYPHLDEKLKEVKATLGELEEDTFMAVKIATPRLGRLEEVKRGEWFERDTDDARDRGSKRRTAIANLMHVVAYYEIDLDYWITAVIKQVAERFVRCIPKALSADLAFELTPEAMRAVMTENAEVAGRRHKLTQSVRTLEYALGKLDEQLEGLKET